MIPHTPSRFTFAMNSSRSRWSFEAEMSGLALESKQSPSRSSREHISSGTMRSRTSPRCGSIGCPREYLATSCFSHSMRVRALDSANLAGKPVARSRWYIQSGIYCGRGRADGIKERGNLFYFLPRNDMAPRLNRSVWLYAVKGVWAEVDGVSVT